MKIVQSRRLSVWCKSNAIEAQKQSDGRAMKGYAGVNPASILEKLVGTVLKANAQGTDITYGLGENRQSRQMVYFFVGTEAEVLKKLY